MLRSLFSGVSGLRAHQTMMDVVGNNIANVNTAGYKSGQAVFEDTLSQMLRASGAPQNGTGGTNPAQVGLGVHLAGIQTNFAQGASQMTGRSTDLAIQGDGFFVVREGGEDLFTRAGSFSFDANGTLVTPEGAVVRGWMADSSGNINTNGSLSDIALPLGTLFPPTATQNASIGGNLPTDAAVGDKIVTSIDMYDAKGTSYPVTVTFTKTADDAWDFSADTGDPATNIGTGSLAFDPANGTLTSPTTVSLTPGLPGPAGGTVTLDLAKMSQFGSDNTVAALSQDGAGMGSLQAFTISDTGTLIGVFSNGLKRPLGQIALASFNNPAGLEKVGNSMFRSAVNAGQPQYGVAGTGGRGTLASGTLEMSNVDLAQEFTNLIIAQRGFQANSRVITASDEILQDLVNLKR
jgi:flagellar hook protein FlgE